MRSCAANSLECEGVVYFCVSVRDLVLFAIGSFRFWIAWMVRKFSVSMLDLVRLAIGSWSPAELIVTCVFLEFLLTFVVLRPCKLWPCGFFGHPWKWVLGILPELLVLV